LKLQALAMSYGGTSTTVTVPPKPSASSSAIAGTAKPAASACQTATPERAPHAGCRCESHASEPPATVSRHNGQAESNGYPKRPNGLPDFTKMDVAQRLAYHRERLGLGR
jgi:hypothetical protein